MSTNRYADEALTRAQALKSMTLDAAYSVHAEDYVGSLEKGKKADFVVLDRDIMDPSSSSPSASSSGGGEDSEGEEQWRAVGWRGGKGGWRGASAGQGKGAGGKGKGWWPGKEILETRVRATVLDGEVVYGALGDD